LEGHLKKLPVVCAISSFLFLAHSSQLALIVLNAASLGTGRLPADWQIKVNHGRPDFSVCTEGDQPCVRLKSVRASFALERGVDVDPAQMPYLSWRWKVTQLPAGGDFRRAATDDQAAQLLVLFADRRVITYLWDSTAPKDTAQSASSVPLVHIFAIVCRSGISEANRWIDENHNLESDYQRAFGKAPPHVKGLRIQINSQHTGTVAESFFGDVAFRSTLQ
jgi:Protein of unknown function (DUF3047)